MPCQAHRLELGGQAVGVPAEAALDLAPAHRLVARDEVLDVAGQQVAVVRQPVGERRAVVEDELVGAVGAGLALLDRWPGTCRRAARTRGPAPRSRGTAGSTGRVGRGRSWGRPSGLLRCVVSSCLTRTTPVVRDRGTTSVVASARCGCDGTARWGSGSSEAALARGTRSSGGSPLMTARTPVPRGYGGRAGANQIASVAVGGPSQATRSSAPRTSNGAVREQLERRLHRPVVVAEPLVAAGAVPPDQLLIPPTASRLLDDHAAAPMRGDRPRRAPAAWTYPKRAPGADPGPHHRRSARPAGGVRPARTTSVRGSCRLSPSGLLLDQVGRPQQRSRGPVSMSA